MSNQNNMQAFITLNQIADDGQIEINPAFIVYMQRSIAKTEPGEGMPCTIIRITTGHTLWVWETPEQIAQLQMDATEKIMGSVMDMTARMIQNIDELGEW
jgi:hypothetical protein